jgi:hypothetical protein
MTPDELIIWTLFQPVEKLLARVGQIERRRVRIGLTLLVGCLFAAVCYLVIWPS